MKKLFFPTFLCSAMCMVSILGLLGPMYGVHLNIKQAVAAEVLYLIAACVVGWNTSTYSEELSKVFSAWAAVASAIGLQILVVAVYWLYHWIMS